VDIVYFHFCPFTNIREDQQHSSVREKDVSTLPDNIIERFYLTRETDNNNYYKIASNKQKKTIELVHNSA